MRSNKQHLTVFLEKEQIATLFMKETQLHWQYNENWQSKGFAISPHLPLHGHIPPLNVQSFLRNCLPEGQTFETLAQSLQLSKFNTLGFIQALGMDLPGSLIITTHELLSDSSYFRLITRDELINRLDQQNFTSLLMWDGKPRLSVAGVQDKLNVVITPKGEMGFGEGNLCSTHLLKFERQKQSHLIFNEYLSMQLAKQCGLNIASVHLEHFGAHNTLLVERFDRQFVSLNEVKRKQVIDGCQALNLPPEYKYERNFGSGRDVAGIRDGVSLPDLFAFANQCVHPAVTKLQLLDWVLFNLFIFNCDAHGKNVSFFINAQGISLAPFYDLINIKMYSEFEHQLAMGLGDEFDVNDIRAYQLADFADSCNLSRALVASRLTSLAEKLIHALQQNLKIKLQEEEARFLHNYQKLVIERCTHLLEHSKEIVSIDL